MKRRTKIRVMLISQSKALLRSQPFGSPTQRCGQCSEAPADEVLQSNSSRAEASWVGRWEKCKPCMLKAETRMPWTHRLHPCPPTSALLSSSRNLARSTAWPEQHPSLDLSAGQPGLAPLATPSGFPVQLEGSTAPKEGSGVLCKPFRGTNYT